MVIDPGSVTLLFVLYPSEFRCSPYLMLALQNNCLIRLRLNAIIFIKLAVLATML
jgi:hypothetical protein